MNLTARVFAVGEFEFDVLQACIRRNGVEQSLRPQAFDVLLHLIEQRHRVLTKDELIQAVWGHTSVTDNALVQCIAEIRRTLGDDPRQPRFIKTFSKTGYRFIGPVRERFTSSPAEVTLPNVPGRHTVAVMYFDDHSGQPDLHWLREGLADMLITDLARSDKLTILSRQQLYMLLDRIGHSPDEPIRLDEAMEIARRTRVEIVLLGSFAACGMRIRMDAQLYDVSTGQLFAADQLVVSSPEEILTQIDSLALRLQGRLGTHNGGPVTGVAEAMTDNLEAYRYYSLGVEKALSFENTQAVTLLKEAVHLDPKFAMAYARIGYAYAVTDVVRDEGRVYLEKAMQFSAFLNGKDKLSLSAWYAISKSDYADAIQTFCQLIRSYPMEVEAYWRLARLLRGEERALEAVAVLKQGLNIDPESKDLYNVLGGCYLALGRYHEAIETHRRYVTLASGEPNAHDSLGLSLQQSGRYQEAIAEYEAALSLESQFDPATIHLGDTYFQQGRYREAISQYERYIRLTHSDLAKSIGYRNIAIVHLRKDNLADAQAAAEDEMRLGKGAPWSSLLVALAQQDRSKAETLKKLLLKSSSFGERGARNNARMLTYFIGYAEWKSGNYPKAIAAFQQALQQLPATSGLDLYEDCLANAYLEAGRLDDAMAEYQRILEKNPNYPLAQYYLAQVCEQKGEPEKARAARQRFLEIWAQADPDIPEIRKAKAYSL